jgi:hypothetical protein
MKREIVCETCKEKLKKLFPTDFPYPGERIKFVDGKALFSMICDHCGEPIVKDQPACAVSIWATHGRIVYYHWEHDFLTGLLYG